MRYYEVKIDRCINHERYIVRAASIPAAHDKAISLEERAFDDVCKENDETPMARFRPRVKSIVEFCDDSAVIP